MCVICKNMVLISQKIKDQPVNPDNPNWINKDEVGWTCSMSGRKRNAQRNFGDLEADVRAAYILFLLHRREIVSVSQGGVYTVAFYWYGHQWQGAVSFYIYTARCCVLMRSVIVITKFLRQQERTIER